MLPLAEYLQKSKLSELDISGNIRANTKGLIPILAVPTNLKKLQANDSSIVCEVVDCLLH
jgi:hypothetical protein